MSGDSYRLARAAREHPQPTPELGDKLGSSGQRALAQASYSGSARAKARALSQHQLPIRKMAASRAGNWMAFHGR